MLAREIVFKVFFDMIIEEVSFLLYSLRTLLWQ